MHQGLPLDGDLAAAGLYHARQDARQRALAGACLADDGQGLAHLQIERERLDGFHRLASEQAGAVLVGLAEASDLQQGGFDHRLGSLASDGVATDG
ncbi:hypothetical protein D3C85_1269960 [compost metagenome]